MTKRDVRTEPLSMPLSNVKQSKNADEVKKILKDVVANEVTHGDGWANVMAGLAGRMDKRIETSYGQFHLVPDSELEAIYFGDGLGNRLVDIVADDMTREWIHLETTEEEEDTEGKDKSNEDIEILEAELERLDTISYFNEALKWARLYGGSILVIGALDGQDLSQPLNINRIKDINYLRVVDRSDIYLASSIFQMDATKPNFGQPIVLRVIFYVGTRTIYQDVHVSRCIIFKGRRVPSGATLELNAWERFWGLSELQMNYEALRDWGGIMDSIANLMYECVIGKYKLSNLAAMLASGNEAQVINRMEIIQMAKSVIHGVLLGEGEEYTRDSIPLGGMGEIIDRFMARVSSTSGIPITKLFGRSPAGMNATGESDQNDYYDQVKNKQQVKLKPGIRQLIDIMVAWKKIKTPVIIKFNPLFQLTEKEQMEVDQIDAQIGLTKSQMYTQYITSGVLDPASVAEMEFPDEAGIDGGISELPEVETNIPGSVEASTKKAAMTSPPDTDVPVNPIPETANGRVGL